MIPCCSSQTATSGRMRIRPFSYENGPGALNLMAPLQKDGEKSSTKRHTQCHFSQQPAARRNCFPNQCPQPVPAGKKWVEPSSCHKWKLFPAVLPPRKHSKKPRTKPECFQAILTFQSCHLPNQTPPKSPKTPLQEARLKERGATIILRR